MLSLPHHLMMTLPSFLCHILILIMFLICPRIIHAMMGANPQFRGYSFDGCRLSLFYHSPINIFTFCIFHITILLIGNNLFVTSFHTYWGLFMNQKVLTPLPPDRKKVLHFPKCWWGSVPQILENWLIRSASREEAIYSLLFQTDQSKADSADC